VSKAQALDRPVIHSDCALLLHRYIGPISHKSGVATCCQQHDVRAAVMPTWHTSRLSYVAATRPPQTTSQATWPQCLHVLRLQRHSMLSQLLQHTFPGWPVSSPSETPRAQLMHPAHAQCMLGLKALLLLLLLLPLLLLRCRMAGTSCTRRWWPSISFAGVVAQVAAPNLQGGAVLLLEHAGAGSLLLWHVATNMATWWQLAVRAMCRSWQCARAMCRGAMRVGPV
jgi:hypothetical protein